MIDVADHLREHSVLAILRGVPASELAKLGLAIVDGGVRSLEVTFTDADAGDKIRLLRDELPDGVQVGAGTVTTRARAEQARAAGASFLVTPHVAAEVNAFARDHALPVLCGATTPSEIAQALEQGCTFVKLFPAGPLGASYLRALMGPYPGLEVFAVGGVASANARAFLEAGAIGLGIGGGLTSPGGSAAGLAAVSRQARELVGIVTTFRAEPA